MDISQRLQSLRKKSGYSQEQLAEMLGLSRQAVSKWESGQGKPDVDNLIRLAEIYQVSADFILFGRQTDGISGTGPKRKAWGQEARVAAAIVFVTASMAVITVLFITALTLMQKYL